MLVGKVTKLQSSASPIALSPVNKQTQLSSICVKLPTSAGAAPASQSTRRSKSRGSQAPVRSNEVKIFTHAIIGSGSNGIVYRASCHPFKSFALKVCEGKPARLEKELAVLVKCAEEGAKGSDSGKATHIPQVHFAAWSDENERLLVIGMELCVPLTLHDYLHFEAYPLEVGMYLAQEVVEAVASVHKCKCIHRDVKLQNFVFSLEGRLKLIDFGIATDTLEPAAGDVTAGTIAFMSPEMATNVLSPKDSRGVVGAPADVWAVGAILFCIFVQGDLYTNDEEDPQTPGDDVSTSLLRKVARGAWRWPPNASRSVPKPYRELIEKCLSLSPAQRPTLAAIMKEACFKKAGLQVPEAIKAFLSVDALGVDAQGSILVEGASVRKSPLHLVTRLGDETPRGLDARLVQDSPPKSPNSLIDDLLALESKVKGRVSVSRALLTDGSPNQFRPPPALPPAAPVTLVIPRSAYSADDVLLGLLSPPKIEPPPPPPIVETEVRAATVSPALLKKKVPKAKAAPILSAEAEDRERITTLRDQEMEDLVSLFKCQSNNFKHPHHFKFHEKPMNKSYMDGYMCDECGVFYAPKKGWMPYFHCSCGSDLCEKCHEGYVAQCTCPQCGTTLDNYQSLAKHQIKCKVQGRRSSIGRKRARSTNKVPGQEDGGRSRSASRARGRAQSMALAGGPQLSTVPASSIPLVTEPVELNPVSSTEPWSPYESRLKVFANAEAKSSLPTASEHAQLVGESGNWVRYFHYYPEDDASVFVYNIHTGRASGVFLSNTSAIHSAVVGILEDKVLVVDYVDVDSGRDQCRMVSTNEFKETQPTAFSTLMEIHSHNNKLLSQKRAVGTTSVCQTPVNYAMNQAYVYVRWLRHDTKDGLVAFCLSNGSYQLFIQEQIEIRWFEGGRKFKVTSGGQCELFTEEEFNKYPKLVTLINTS